MVVTVDENDVVPHLQAPSPLAWEWLLPLSGLQTLLIWFGISHVPHCPPNLSALVGGTLLICKPGSLTDQMFELSFQSLICLTYRNHLSILTLYSRFLPPFLCIKSVFPGSQFPLPCEASGFARLHFLCFDSKVFFCTRVYTPYYFSPSGLGTTSCIKITLLTHGFPDFTTETSWVTSEAQELLFLAGSLGISSQSPKCRGCREEKQWGFSFLR